MHSDRHVWRPTTNIYLGAINIYVKLLKKNYILGDDVQVKRDGRGERIDGFRGEDFMLVNVRFLVWLREVCSKSFSFRTMKELLHFFFLASFVTNTNSQDNLIFVFEGIPFFLSWKLLGFWPCLKILKALSRCGSYPFATLYPLPPPTHLA